jgi:hypothetical protein
MQRKILVMALAPLIGAGAVLRLTRPNSREFQLYVESQHIPSDITFSFTRRGIGHYFSFFYAEYAVSYGYDLKITHEYVGVLGRFYEEKLPEQK